MKWKKRRTVSISASLHKKPNKKLHKKPNKKLSKECVTNQLCRTLE